MNERIKKLWIEALRSGKYEQGTGALHPYNPINGKAYTFCCLGVLCDVYRSGHPSAQWEPRRGNGEHFLKEQGVLPDEVAIWAGLVDDGGWPIDDPVVNGESLTTLNDGGMSFAEIADRIEQHL